MYIRSTNSRLGHFERQKFGGSGNPDSMFGGGGPIVGSFNKLMYFHLQAKALHETRNTANPQRLYRDANALKSEIAPYEPWDACNALPRMRKSSKDDWFPSAWVCPVNNILSKVEITQRIREVIVTASNRMSNPTRKIEKLVPITQVTREARTKGVEEGIIESERSRGKSDVRLVAEQMPGATKEVATSAWEKAGDIVASPFVWAFGWGTGPDASGKYKEEELERERVKAEKKAQDRRDAAREGPSVTDNFWNWWEGDEDTSPHVPAATQPSRPAPTPSRPTPTPSRPAPRPTPTPPQPKPDSGWNLDAIGGFFTDLLGVAAPIAGEVYTDRQQETRDREEAYLSNMARQTALMQHPQQPRPASGGGSNTGLYIGLGVAAFAIIVGTIVLIN